MVIAPCDARSDVLSQDQKMAWIPGGTFRMGSDRYYPEEAPVHDVTVAGFWIDRTPVTNADFHHFVRATRYVTLAELKPNAADYPASDEPLAPGNHIVRIRGKQ
jgi:formylglycine-generating enzyme